MDRWPSTTLSTAMTAGRVGIWEWDIAADRVLISPVTAALFDMSDEQCKAGVTISECVAPTHPRDRARRMAEIASAMDGKPDYHVKYRTITGSREEKLVLSRGLITSIGKRGTLRGSGILVDISSLASQGENFDLEKEGYLSDLDRFAGSALDTWRLAMALNGPAKALMFEPLRQIMRSLYLLAELPEQKFDA